MIYAAYASLAISVWFVASVVATRLYVDRIRSKNYNPSWSHNQNGLSAFECFFTWPLWVAFFIAILPSVLFISGAIWTYERVENFINRTFGDC